MTDELFFKLLRDTSDYLATAPFQAKIKEWQSILRDEEEWQAISRDKSIPKTPLETDPRTRKLEAKENLRKIGSELAWEGSGRTILAQLIEGGLGTTAILI